jgi:hypothetical protein
VRPRSRRDGEGPSFPSFAFILSHVGLLHPRPPGNLWFSGGTRRKQGQGYDIVAGLYLGWLTISGRDQALICSDSPRVAATFSLIARLVTTITGRSKAITLRCELGGGHRLPRVSNFVYSKHY